LDRDCNVTAIVCANDELAAGAIMGAAAHAWNVPGDVSVTGWDNTPLGEYMPPGLSTVHVDAVMLGKNAIRRLICTIRPDWPAEQDINALNAIIWPGSVAAPARDLPLDD
jgi:LacI family transcriptional regulator